VSGAPRNLRIGVVTTEIYVIKLQNIRPTAVTNVLITSTMPGGLQFLQSQPPPTTEAGNVLTYKFPQLAPFSTALILVQAGLLPQTPAGTVLAHTVTVRDDQANTIQGAFNGGVRAGPNNSPGKLTVTLTTTRQALAGSSLKSTLAVNNVGTQAAGNVVVTLAGPQALQFSSSVPAPTAVQTANGSTTLTWNVGSIPGPGNAVIRVTQKVAADAASGTALTLTTTATAADGRSGTVTKSVTVR
jgi:hypothetical protein